MGGRARLGYLAPEFLVTPLQTGGQQRYNQCTQTRSHSGIISSVYTGSTSSHQMPAGRPTSHLPDAMYNNTTRERATCYGPTPLRFDLRAGRGVANTQQLWRQNFCSRGTSPVELSSSPAA